MNNHFLVFLKAHFLQKFDEITGVILNLLNS